jgi:DNA-binding response OmpR family regulator
MDVDERIIACMVQTSAPPLVLVADDEPTMLELVARHLKSLDDPRLEVIQASDGEEAWRMAQEHLPDLVVLDVMMPGMSGWEVCRKIREDVALAHTAVVMLTGIGENLNQMTSPLYGADAHVDKPFEFEDLDTKVKEALDARAAQREAVARPVRTNGVAAPARAASPAKAKKASAKGAKAAAKKKTPGKKKSTRSTGSAKGKAKTMAAKKSAKKGAKKSAKKGAKKGAKKKK